MKTSALMLTALFTALTAVGAMLSLPLPFTPVPVSLASLACMLAGALSGSKCGVWSQVVYLLLGAAGIPVFHNFTGGIGVLLGPTGGYLLGYIAIAFCCGLFLRNNFSVWRIVAACSLGTLLCYFLGTCWFVLSTGTGIAAALAGCVLPFLPGDVLKIFATVILIRRLKPVLEREIMIK